jgi:hypothetical protein
MQHQSAVSFRRVGPRIRLAKPGTPFRITPAGHKLRTTVFADQHAPSRRTSTPFTEEDRKLVRHVGVLFRQRGWRATISPTTLTVDASCRRDVTTSRRSLLRPLASNFPLITGARKLILVGRSGALMTPTPPAAPSPPSNRAYQALRKPPVHRSQQFARLLHLALVAPEACYCSTHRFCRTELNQLPTLFVFPNLIAVTTRHK